MRKADQHLRRMASHSPDRLGSICTMLPQNAEALPGLVLVHFGGHPRRGEVWWWSSGTALREGWLHENSTRTPEEGAASVAPIVDEMVAFLGCSHRRRAATAMRTLQEDPLRGMEDAGDVRRASARYQ